MKKYLLIAATFLIALAIASPASALRLGVDDYKDIADDSVVTYKPSYDGFRRDLGVRTLAKGLPGSTEDKELSLRRLSIFSHGGLHRTHQFDDMFLSKLREKIDSIRNVLDEIKKSGLGGYIAVIRAHQNGGGGTTPVPEPGTIMLMGIGLVGLASIGRRKFKQ